MNLIENLRSIAGIFSDEEDGSDSSVALACIRAAAELLALKSSLSEATARAERAEAELKKARERLPDYWASTESIKLNGQVMVASKNKNQYGDPTVTVPLYLQPIPAPAAQEKNPVQWLEDEGDLIAIPRGLVGAACSAIDKQRPADKVLSALRYYTMNAPAAQVPQSCWLIEQPATTNWPSAWLTLKTFGTPYVTSGKHHYTATAEHALKFHDRESAEEYICHHKIQHVTATEHIFDAIALLQEVKP